MINLSIVTHTLGKSMWMDKCVDSVKINLPDYGEHKIISLHQSDDFIQARWEAFQSQEFVALVDDDDEVCNNSIQICMEAFRQNPTVGIVFTDQIVIDENSNILREDHGELRYRDVARSPQTIHHLAIVRRGAISKEALDISIRAGTGIEWMIKSNAALNFGAIHVPIQGYKWRKHPGQHSDRDFKNFISVAGILRNATRSWLKKDDLIKQYLPEVT